MKIPFGYFSEKKNIEYSSFIFEKKVFLVILNECLSETESPFFHSSQLVQLVFGSLSK